MKKKKNLFNVVFPELIFNKNERNGWNSLSRSHDFQIPPVRVGHVGESFSPVPLAPRLDQSRENAAARDPISAERRSLPSAGSRCDTCE